MAQYKVTASTIVNIDDANMEDAAVEDYIMDLYDNDQLDLNSYQWRLVGVGKIMEDAEV